MSVHAHRTERVAGSEGRKEASGVGGGIRVGGGNGDGNRGGGGNGDVNGDRDGDGAVRRTGVEANKGIKDGKRDGSGGGAGTGTGTVVETRGRTQNGNGDRSGDGNESSSGGGNGDEDGNEKGDVDEGGEEAKKGKKPHKKCRRDQALSFRTHHHLCKRGMSLASTRQLRSQGPMSVHAHDTER